MKLKDITDLFENHGIVIYSDETGSTEYTYLTPDLLKLCVKHLKSNSDRFKLISNKENNIIEHLKNGGKVSYIDGSGSSFRYSSLKEILEKRGDDLKNIPNAFDLIYNTIEISDWWDAGEGKMLKREHLSKNHPQHPYNYIKAKYNVNPEDFGITNPHNLDNLVTCPKCKEIFNA